jgi:hypothetical protein
VHSEFQLKIFTAHNFRYPFYRHNLENKENTSLVFLRRERHGTGEKGADLRLLEGGRSLGVDPRRRLRHGKPRPAVWCERAHEAAERAALHRSERRGHGGLHVGGLLRQPHPQAGLQRLDAVGQLRQRVGRHPRRR